MILLVARIEKIFNGLQINFADLFCRSKNIRQQMKWFFDSWDKKDGKNWEFIRYTFFCLCYNGMGIFCIPDKQYYTALRAKSMFCLCSSSWVDRKACGSGGRWRSRCLLWLPSFRSTWAKYHLEKTCRLVIPITENFLL